MKTDGPQDGGGDIKRGGAKGGSKGGGKGGGGIDKGQKVRLQRVMADAGVAARRVCEEMIERGLVSVNGEPVRKLPVFVDPENDEIMVEGRRLPKAQRRLYLMLNKPAGHIVSAADEPELNRPTVMDLIDHPSAPRLFPVGRLEYDTTGLLILTNDGELANRLTHPRYRVPKTYHALVKGTIDEGTKGALQTKIRAVAERELGARIGVPAIDIISRDEGRTLIQLTMEEGPTRHLKETFEFLGMPIKRLTRTAVGGLQLKGLAVGRWRELTREEITLLRKAGPGTAKRGHQDHPVGALPSKNRRPKPQGPRRERATEGSEGRAARPARPSEMPRPPKPSRDRRPPEGRGGEGRGSEGRTRGPRPVRGEGGRGSRPTRPGPRTDARTSRPQRTDTRGDSRGGPPSGPRSGPRGGPRTGPRSGPGPRPGPRGGRGGRGGRD
jgi:23S rRNA pseudouridine2605 synthase